MSILVIIPIRYNFPDKVYNLVMDSSVKCDVIVVSGNKLVCNDNRAKVVYVHADMSKSKSFRVSTAINRALETVDLSKYDWLIKIDDDADFQRDFIEKNIKGNYDLMGKGIILVIRVSKFIDLMSGRFFVCNADDTYLFAKFSIERCNIIKWGWLYDPISNNNRCVNSREESFLIGFDSGRMKLSYRKKFYKKPLVQLIGWIIGRYIYPYKLPVFHDKWVQYV